MQKTISMSTPAHSGHKLPSVQKYPASFVSTKRAQDGTREKDHPGSWRLRKETGPLSVLW